MKYNRMIIKLSGEQLADESGHGIDKKFVKWLASEIKKVHDAGVQVAVVSGAGNWIRGKDIAGDGIERSTADYMGMLAGIINGQALMDIFQSVDMPTRCMSAIRVEQICEPYIRRKAIRHMEKGRVVIISGGTGKPQFTHDTAAVMYGLELDCDVAIKASNIDGVYDDDPHQNTEAKLLAETTFQHALENPKIKVMDKAGLGLASENTLPIIVMNIKQEDNLLKIAEGEKVGTLIS